MSAVLKTSVAGELVEAEEFFAPTPYGLIDGLFGQYNVQRSRMERIAAAVDADIVGVLHYFERGNASDQGRHFDVTRLFELPKAIKALDADFWSRALAMTDVYDAMPQARRDEWNKSIREFSTPEFTEDNVRATIEALLAARGQFLAERVDGLFRALSGNHVTNEPQGFNKRMILEYVFNSYSGDSKAGAINDLRCVIAKFMGRDEPRWNTTRADVDICRLNYGEWHSLDGGALRLRVYKKATAHLEIHPDMAWRLNAILHTLYPHALPPDVRRKPEKPSKVFKMIGRPLPFAVLSVLRDTRQTGNDLSLPYLCDAGKNIMAEAIRTLEYIGGVHEKNVVRFDYDPRYVLREILTSGCIPDQKAHQFYPTPERIARAAVEMAQIGPDHRCLEPSAGQGGLADFMPKDHLVCIEVSKLHCDILQAKGYEVIEADFLAWAKLYNVPDNHRIVMNPPYSEGRWLAHLQAAASLLAPGGRVVCILPASQRGKDLIPGLAYEWSQVFANQFDGTSIDVAIYAGSKA